MYIVKDLKLNVFSFAEKREIKIHDRHFQLGHGDNIHICLFFLGIPISFFTFLTKVSYHLM